MDQSQVLCQTIEISGPAGSIIRADVRVPQEGNATFPVVLVCHGFKGYRLYHFFPYLSEQLANSGCATINIDFSHNGIAADPTEFSELDLFEKNTFSLEVQDIQCVMRDLFTESLPSSEKLNASELYIVGHSRGGLAALLAASEDSRIQKVASIGSPASLAYRLTPEVEQRWRAAEVDYVESSRTGQELPLGIALLEEMVAGRHRLEQAVRALQIPHLIIHGEGDETVPLENGRQLAEWGPRARLEIIPGANHVLCCKHPFAGPSQELTQAIRLLADFFLA